MNKEKKVCSECGSDDVCYTMKTGEDSFLFFCRDCGEDFKSDNSDYCCPNCGNTNYECLSEKNHIRECDECDIDPDFWPVCEWEFLGLVESEQEILKNK